MTYTIAYYGAYPEDHGKVRVDSLEEAKEWIKENRSYYDYDLGNLSVYPTPNYIDVYELMDEQ